MAVGATVNPSTYNSTGDYVAAGNTFDGLVSTGLTTPIKPAFIVQKWYFKPGQWPGTTVPAEVQALANHGCRFYVCFFPNTSNGTGVGIASELANLRTALNTFKAAGINFKAILCQESNAQNKFNSPAAYQTYCAYYAPAIRAAGIKLVYDPALIATAGGASAVNYYPGDQYVDEILVDYYCTAYNAGTRMANIAALADGHTAGSTSTATGQNGNGTAAPIPFGIGEWGASATGVAPTLAEWHNYNNYIVSFFSGRISAGKAWNDIVFFNGPSSQTNNNILTSTDFKIPDFQNVYTTLSGSAPPVVSVTNPGDQTNNVGDAVSLQIAATDSASETLTYTATGLPPGASVGSSSGLVSGSSLTTAGTYTVTVKATDTSGSFGTTTFTWTVLTVTVNTGPFFNYVQSFFTNRLTAGKVNADLLLFNGNTAVADPYISASTDARLPFWDAIYDALNGKVSPGAVHMFGHLDLVITQTAQMNALTQPTILNSSALPNAFADSGYQVQFQAAGGVAPYFFIVAAGSQLPPGYTLTEDGLLSGTTVIPGNYSFDITVSDSQSVYGAVYASIYEGQTYTATFTLTVLPVTPAGNVTPRDITVQLLDNNLIRQAVIPFMTLTAQLFYNFVGSWTMTVPYSDDLWALISAGDWIIDVDWNGMFSFGGKIEAPGYQDAIPGSPGSSSSVSGPTITLAGADFLALIANRIAFPNPTAAWGSGISNGINLTDSDAVGPVPCETAIKHYVSRNVGSQARPERKVGLMDIAPDLGRGANVSYTVKFASGVDLNLMDIIRTLVATGGPMGVSLARSGQRLTFDTYVPKDLSGSAWFSKNLNNLTSVSLALTDPTCTDALVRGQTTFLDQNIQSSQWSRVEVFVDQSSSTDPAQIAQAGTDALNSGAAGPSLAITTTDIPFLAYGKDYNLGDLVTVEVRPGDTYTDIVTSVMLTVDPTQNPPVSIIPVIGYSSDPGAADPSFTAQLLSRVRRLERRLDAQRG